VIGWKWHDGTHYNVDLLGAPRPTSSAEGYLNYGSTFDDWPYPVHCLCQGNPENVFW